MVQEVSVSMEKIVMFFGVITTFLLGIIAFFLRLVIEEFKEFKVKVEDTRIKVAKLEEHILKQA